MYELMIFKNKACDEHIYHDATQATHRMTVETPEDLCALWSALLPTYEGTTYSIWDQDDCILAGAYDPNDMVSLNDYFGQTLATLAQTTQKQPTSLGGYMEIYQNDIDVCLVDKDTAEHYLPCICYLDEEDQKDPDLQYSPLENWLRSLPLSHINQWNGCPLAVVDTEYSADQTDFLLGYSEEGFESREWSNLSKRADWAEADFAQRLAYLEHGTSFERPFDALNMDVLIPAECKELCQFLAEHDNALVCEGEADDSLLVYSITTNEKGRIVPVTCDVYARETEPGKGLASTIEGKIQLAKCKQHAASQGISAEKQQPNRA